MYQNSILWPRTFWTQSTNILNVPFLRYTNSCWRISKWIRENTLWINQLNFIRKLKTKFRVQIKSILLIITLEILNEIWNQFWSRNQKKTLAYSRDASRSSSTFEIVKFDALSPFQMVHDALNTSQRRKQRIIAPSGAYKMILLNHLCQRVLDRYWKCPVYELRVLHWLQVTSRDTLASGTW